MLLLLVRGDKYLLFGELLRRLLRNRQFEQQIGERLDRAQVHAARQHVRVAETVIVGRGRADIVGDLIVVRDELLLTGHHARLAEVCVLIHCVGWRVGLRVGCGCRPAELGHHLVALWTLRWTRTGGEVIHPLWGTGAAGEEEVWRSFGERLAKHSAYQAIAGNWEH